MRSSQDLLEVNAYIERLIMSDGNDAEARHAVTEFASTIPCQSIAGASGSVSFPGEKTHGLTPEQGNVEIENSEKETTKQFSSGSSKVARVGYYKLTRHRKKLWHKSAYYYVTISHYWKSDMSTMSTTEDVESWRMKCSSTMEAEWFGRVQYEKHTWGWFHITEHEYKELWGPKPGTIHAGGITLGISTY